MWFRCVVILLMVAFNSKLTHGQFFRKDYRFFEDLNNFYKVNTQPKTWSEANVKCLREGATLFYPENEEEAAAVTALWRETQCQIDQIYIGAGNSNVDDIYETVDGRSISEVYANWASGEPDNSGDSGGCVVMQCDGTLKIEKCYNKYDYICKKTLETVQWNKECNTPYPHYKYNKTLDRCYKFHLAPKNWTDAYAICNAEQSYLAIINSRAEDQHLIEITAAAPKDDVGGNYLRGAVHLGFHDKNGVWETIKGVLLDDSGFGGGWGNTQPDGGGNETCGSMFYTGELNDIGCWQRMFFICEHEIERCTEDFGEE